MRILSITIILFMLPGCSMMQEKLTAANTDCKSDFYVLETPIDRTISDEKRNECFGHEYTHIQNRKHDVLGVSKNKSLDKIAGLALSGGGVKSTSFQLGMLAGLHEAQVTAFKPPPGHGHHAKENNQVLHYIDYISSVSGGTWASAAYWAWLDEEKSLFRCLDGTVNGFSNTSVACRLIGETLIPRKQGTFLNRESWRKQRAELLLGDDFKLAHWRYPIEGYDETAKYNINKCNSISDEDLRNACFKAKIRQDRYIKLQHKPYPIFNASHSIDITTEGKSSRNFPFQVTPDYIGTVVDCNSFDINGDGSDLICPESRFRLPAHRNNKPRKGFFLKLHKTLSDNNDLADAQTRRQAIRLLINDYSEAERDIETFVKPEPGELDYLFRNDFPATTQTRDFYVSHAMASSGGLVATLISTNVEIVSSNPAVSDNVREKYILADGGKSDNLGILPLIERNAKLIIASQIAGDPDTDLIDLRVALIQANRLYDVDITNRCGTSPFEDCLIAYLDGVKVALKDSNIFIQKYSGRDGEQHQLIFVKPTHDNSNYFRKMLESDYASVFSVLRAYEERLGKNKWQFPQSPTLTPTYKREVMFAYYLLGKHIATNGLYREIHKWIGANYP